MNITTIKPTLLSLTLGLAMSFAAATTAANAAQDVLNDAIHDYADDAWGSNEVINTKEGDVYHTDNLLNEASYDYVSEDVAESIESDGEMERAEFAAFEESTTRIPWEISSKHAW